MGPACAHPTADDVGRLLTRLLGRRVVVKRGTPIKTMPVAVSAYVVPEGQLAAVCAFDLEFANYAGAALPMVPVAIATDAIRTRTVEAETLENLAEVANILTSLFNGSSSHVKLRELSRTPPAPPGDIIALTGKPVRRVDLDVDITGYGIGHMALFFAAGPLAA